MKSHKLMAVCVVMYFLCAVATVGLVAPIFLPLTLSHGEKFVTVFIILVLGFMAARFLCMGASVRTANRIMRATFIWLFITYVFVVVDFTLISNSFGRSLSNIFLLSGQSARQYILENTNFVPLRTVSLYINAYVKGNVEPYIAVENLIGNFFVFMPFALFVPSALRFINSAIKFFLFVALFIIAIEIMQIIFLTGSADVDDFILNLSGAMAAYGLLHLRGTIKTWY